MSGKGVWAGAALALLAGGALAGPERVDFPSGYPDKFAYVTTRDMHLGGNLVAEIFANAAAVSSGKGEASLGSGAVIAMPVYSVKLDANNQPILDANGRMIKDQLRVINVMEKRTGWGAEYPESLRNGEWEYASFSPQGVKGTAPTTACFECHGSLKGVNFDFIYSRPDLADVAKAKN